MTKQEHNRSKAMSAAMKILQVSAIGTMLFSVGSAYAFNPDKVLAGELEGNSELTDTTIGATEQTNMQVSERRIVIGPGGPSGETAAEKKIREAKNAALKIENATKKMYQAKKKELQANPPVKGAKIKSITNFETYNYVKNGKIYKYYEVKWTKTSKKNAFGIPTVKASALDKLELSKTGNHIAKGAKMNAAQKKSLAAYKKNTALKKKYRYVVTYIRENTTLHYVENDGKNYLNASKYHKDIVLAATSVAILQTNNIKERERSVKDAWDLHVLSKKGTKQGWINAFNLDKPTYAGYQLDVPNSTQNKQTKETKILNKLFPNAKIVNYDNDLKGDTSATVFKKRKNNALGASILSVYNYSGTAREAKAKNMHYIVTVNEDFIDKETDKVYQVVKAFDIPMTQKEFYAMYKRYAKGERTSKDIQMIGYNGMEVVITW